MPTVATTLHLAGAFKQAPSALADQVVVLRDHDPLMSCSEPCGRRSLSDR